MPDPRKSVAGFLADTDWNRAQSTPLAGDASRRRYVRLRLPTGATAILMDAPPDLCGAQQAFVDIASYLGAIGLAAPRVLKADLADGYLLLQDFGDRLFANEAAVDPSSERRIYTLACDVLIQLSKHAPPDGLQQASPAYLTELADLVFTHYAVVSEAEKAKACGALYTALSKALTGPDVLVLRDYHGENLVLRPAETGIAQAGLLDFQDALRGHPAYDLVSLLQDARRDLAPGLEEALIHYYLDQTGQDAAAFRLAYDTIAVQRHLRILGIFARLSRDGGKPHYLDYVPRTWAHLQTALARPGLEDLAQSLACLPAPTPTHMRALRGD